jgi:hypothetical protein
MLAAAVLATIPRNTTGAVNARQPNLDNLVASHIVCANDQTPIPDGNSGSAPI